jgi:hypothetical protein
VERACVPPSSRDSSASGTSSATGGIWTDSGRGTAVSASPSAIESCEHVRSVSSDRHKGGRDAIVSIPASVLIASLAACLEASDAGTGTDMLASAAVMIASGPSLALAAESIATVVSELALESTPVSDPVQGAGVAMPVGSVAGGAELSALALVPVLGAGSGSQASEMGALGAEPSPVAALALVLEGYR